MPIVYLPENCSCHTVPCNCQPHVDDCDSCNPTPPCTTDTGCPILLDSKCIIYKKFGGSPSGLTNISLPNGANLEFVLDTIDDFLATLSSYSFPPFVTTCIGITNTTILTLANFMQAVDNQFCAVKANQNTLNNTIITEIDNLTTIVDTINHPNITSSSVGLAINATDTIKQILIKLKDAYFSLYSAIISDQSPDFAPINSNTISWFLAGTKGHTPTANIKKSLQPGNVLQLLPDGLFVGNLPALSQSLSYDAGTNSICLSGGGGCVPLPVDSDDQTLSLSVLTNILSISSGNSVDLTPILPSFSQVSISPSTTNSIVITANGTANTNIAADVRISSNVGNSITIQSDGLFVPAPTPAIIDTDELVKAFSTGTAGTLINKVEGCISGSVTTAISYNAISDKMTVCSTLDASSLLSEISSTPALLAAFTNMVQTSSCFKFRFINIGVGANTYGYTDCNGTVFSGLAISGGSSIEVCGQQATTGTDQVYVFNLGFC